MMEHHQKCKGVSAEHQAGLGVCRATQHFDDGTSKSKICGVLAENDACDGGQHKKSLHPSRRMAWKILRHGVAVFFPSGCRSQTPYRTKRHEYKKILQISENNSVFILLLQNKALSLWRNSNQQTKNETLNTMHRSNPPNVKYDTQRKGV